MVWTGYEPYKRYFNTPVDVVGPGVDCGSGEGFRGPGRFCWPGWRSATGTAPEKKKQFYFSARVKIGSGSGSELGL